jgi:hypothetical protein
MAASTTMMSFVVRSQSLLARDGIEMPRILALNVPHAPALEHNYRMSAGEDRTSCCLRAVCDAALASVTQCAALMG